MTDQTHQIPSQLQTGKDLGMQLMDQALLDAIQAQGDRSGRRLHLRQRQAAVHSATSPTRTLMPKPT